MVKDKVKLLVTGSTGFIGLNIVEDYLVRGHHVISIADTPFPKDASKVFRNYEGKLHHEVVDVTDFEELQKVMCDAKPDEVVIGAAITPADGITANLHKRTLNINVIGALNTLEAANQASVKKILYLSSASVYGIAHPFAGCLSEESSIPDPQTIYGLSKLTAEKYLRQYAKLHSLHLSILRIGTVFGPWERETGIRDTLSPMFQAAKIILQGNQIDLPDESSRDYVYSRDVANVIAAVLNAEPANRLFNLGFGVEWDLEQWCAAASSYADFDWKVASGSINQVELHGGKRPPLCAKRLIEFMGQYDPHTIEEAAKEYMSWLKEWENSNV